MPPLAPRFRVRLLSPLALLALALGVFHSTQSSAAEQTGEAIFNHKCAVCHGPHGEGTAKHKEALSGTKSLAQLQDVIAKTMPEEEPGTLPTKDSRLVASFIYDAMYSPTAQSPHRPARIELARLTVRQYRMTVADLVGSFRSQIYWNEKPGLKAEYFKSKKSDNSTRVLERVDPQVKFDFGVESPLKDKIDPHEFSIYWQGSVLARRNGRLRLHHPHRACRAALAERPQCAAGRRVGEIGPRQRASRVDLSHRRPALLLAARILQSPTRRRRQKEKEGR